MCVFLECSMDQHIKRYKNAIKRYFCVCVFGVSSGAVYNVYIIVCVCVIIIVKKNMPIAPVLAKATVHTPTQRHKHTCTQ